MAAEWYHWQDSTLFAVHLSHVRYRNWWQRFLLRV